MIRRLRPLLLLWGLAAPASGQGDYDPFAVARRDRSIAHREATVPPQCYTRTDGRSNPCWTCHTVGQGPNLLDDSDLQAAYSFGAAALENHWTNLFVDRRAAALAIDAGAIEAWIDGDNYASLRAALARRPDVDAWRPDLDLGRGFASDGFAADGSGWRAIRFKPFPGTFWPTNGAADDVMIRLPAPFGTEDGRPSPAALRLNLALLEAAIAGPPGPLDRIVEPVDERPSGVDLDGDGRIGPGARRIRRLPPTYAGDAGHVALVRHVYPAGTEFLHTVRYLDLDRPGARSVRVKEVRYARKVRDLDRWAIGRAHAEEAEAREEGRLPFFPGSPELGLANDFGWQLTGYIEDGRGRLRLQTAQELQFCMGCHGSLGVTVDHTFAFARKVPGPAGWRPQDLVGMADAPQVGHDEPEALTYLRRAGGGDEYRANTEMIDRFFEGGRVRAAEVRRAAPGGDRDLAWLLSPSPARALELNRIYRVLVDEQSFTRGRDPIPGPVGTVHRRIESTDTGLADDVRTDGVLWLDWGRE